ncbi:MAG: toxin-antitoxin system YwqK family antitoxin, partial [Kofleriaceae bacterium]
PPSIPLTTTNDAAAAEPASASMLTCEAGTTAKLAAAPEPTMFCARPDGTRDGPFITTFPDGSIEISGSYVNGVLSGSWQRMHPGGSVAEIGAYTSGQRDGRWRQSSTTGTLLGEYELVAGTGTEKRWYNDGQLYSELGVKAGIPHGSYRVFAPDGSLLINAKYSDGKLDGAHLVGTRQTMRLEETFVNGVLRGPRRIWMLGALLSDESYDRRGKLDGPFALWRNARIKRVEGAYTRGVRTGTWTWNDRWGNKERTGSYVDGKRDGKWLEYRENKLYHSGSYVQDKPTGEFLYFDRAGNEIGRSTLNNGTGTLTTFYFNKRPASRQQMVNGRRDGVYQELTSRGTLVVDGRYRADVKHGTWREWTSDGVLLLEQSWKRGRLDGVVRKYADGKLVLEATYKGGKADGPYTELRLGKPAITGQFIDDQRHGQWTSYDAEGAVVLTATYNHGVLDGPWRELNAGVVIEGVMTAGRKTGTWTRTDRGGNVVTHTYVTAMP